MLVAQEEAQQWFELGYQVLGVSAQQPVDVGALAMPSYAGGRRAFQKQIDEQETVRRDLECGLRLGSRYGVFK